MSLFHASDSKLGIIAGKYVMSGGCTDVIGGTMTAGTADSAGSALITFAPPFISAPIINASIYAGVAGGGAVLTASNFQVQLTGVTVSNAYVAALAGSGCIVSLTAVGLQRL